ncbi:MAG: hypothetical protein WA871_00160 [Candidatus Acidiferrales bacterium]
MTKLGKVLSVYLSFFCIMFVPAAFIPGAGQNGPLWVVLLWCSIPSIGLTFFWFQVRPL